MNKSSGCRKGLRRVEGGGWREGVGRLSGAEFREGGGCRCSLWHMLKKLHEENGPLLTLVQASFETSTGLF